jgi:hypothetical protein
VPDADAEAAMRRVCDLIIAGNILGIAPDLTPEAYADAMRIAPSLAGAELPASYAIESHNVEDAVHRFRVRFKSSKRDITGQASWRQVEGVWKIASITLDEVAA